MSKNADIYYFHDREFGYRQVVCHDVVSLVIYYIHGRKVGLLTGGMPRCCEFRYILFTRS